ncbi:hypothetical protein BT67DRAFT_305321 [Trichocladium antarcticum]|uniref:Extracellular membrane protein CFEM domain-containing protein n=1 Tax=Trichocladium antarcticum TaxID=1450529 RepID=A0AAN6UJT6_9PEZI|nr:hypothetical protein BT67DRAFT_305321 [Trichocladium antarcticum]
MAGFRRTALFAVALVTLVFVSTTQAEDTIDFSFYPEKAQPCLYAAADLSKCESDTAKASNSCLCRNGGNFITNAAACIGQESRGDLAVVYDTMEDACAYSKTPISITKQEFMAAANPVTSTSSMVTSTTTSASSTASTEGTTTSSTSTSTSTSTDAAATTAPPDDEQDKEASPGLSHAALAGVIGGASAAGLALLGAIAWFVFRRRRKAGEESHPMLPQHGHAAMASGPYNNNHSPPDTGGFPKRDWALSPDPRASRFNWESPSHLSYPSSVFAEQQVGGYMPNAAPAPSPPPFIVPELDGAAVYPPPTGTAAAPAEMGATPIAATAPLHAQFQAYRPGLPPAGLGWHPSQR